MADTTSSPFFTTNRWVYTCGWIALVCALWNLVGDLYYMEYGNASFGDQGLGTTLLLLDDINNDSFMAQHSSIWGFLAQAGGWMYPIWAFVTVLPLFVGLTSSSSPSSTTTQPHDLFRGLAPCGLLFYGMCIAGGALHNAFAFLTVLPQTYYSAANSSDDSSSSSAWAALVDDNETRETFVLFLNQAQARMVQHMAIGSIPGLVACNVGCLWVMYLVHTCPDTLFAPSRWWFQLGNPLVTSVWVPVVGAMLPAPYGLYVTGCLASWAILLFNMMTVYWVGKTSRYFHCKDEGETERPPLLRKSTSPTSSATRIPAATQTPYQTMS